MRLERKNNEYWKWVKTQAKRNRKSPTWAEYNVMRYLQENGIKYRFQKPVLFKDDKAYIADFVLKGRVLIEVDGDWHNNPEQVTYDQIRDAYFTGRGYKVFRIKNCETAHGQIEEKMQKNLYAS